MLPLLALVAIAAACIAYGFFEANWRRVKIYSVPILPEGFAPLRLLQITDTHLRMRQRGLQMFLERLSEEQFDLVLATGDLLGDNSSAHTCAQLLNGLQGKARAFVFGSSDYYAPVFKNYLDYFLGRRKHGTARNPTESFRQALISRGWIDLNNRTFAIELGGFAVQLSGMDDPYLDRHDPSVLTVQACAGLAICVVHDPKPYRQALAAGFDLVISGHTHGGQIRFPLIGALVTNSTIPRRLARGLSREGDGWLFVSPGLGTGRYAPIRFLCRPEASVLHLVERS